MKGDVVETASAAGKIRPGIVVEYKGIFAVSPDMSSLSYTIVVEYIVLVGLEKQAFRKRIVVDEVLMRKKINPGSKSVKER
jgi:hypothetical protein